MAQKRVLFRGTVQARLQRSSFLPLEGIDSVFVRYRDAGDAAERRIKLKAYTSGCVLVGPDRMQPQVNVICQVDIDGKKK